MLKQLTQLTLIRLTLAVIINVIESTQNALRPYRIYDNKII